MSVNNGHAPAMFYRYLRMLVCAASPCVHVFQSAQSMFACLCMYFHFLYTVAYM